jgi:hypothetical protein
VEFLFLDFVWGKEMKQLSEKRNKRMNFFSVWSEAYIKFFAPCGLGWKPKDLNEKVCVVEEILMPEKNEESFRALLSKKKVLGGCRVFSLLLLLF